MHSFIQGTRKRGNENGDEKTRAQNHLSLFIDKYREMFLTKDFQIVVNVECVVRLIMDCDEKQSNALVSGVNADSAIWLMVFGQYVEKVQWNILPTWSCNSISNNLPNIGAEKYCKMF